MSSIFIKVFYFSDAGSYTSDAVGKASLDHLFDFDPVNNRIDFSPDTKARVRILESAIARMSQDVSTAAA